MHFRKGKFLALAFPLALLLSIPAMANNCNDFGSYTCANGTSNNIHITGQMGTNSSIGTTGGLITGSSFNLSLVGGNSDSDIIIVAIFNGAVGGSINGTNFTPLGTFPLQGALGAYGNTLAALGIAAGQQQYGYVDLGKGLASGGSMLVSLNGLPNGTALYGVGLSSVSVCTGHGKSKVCSWKTEITDITANSEAGMVRATVPEPGTLTLLGTGLIGLASLIRKRLKS